MEELGLGQAGPGSLCSPSLGIVLIKSWNHHQQPRGLVLGQAVESPILVWEQR